MTEWSNLPSFKSDHSRFGLIKKQLQLTQLTNCDDILNKNNYTVLEILQNGTGSPPKPYCLMFQSHSVISSTSL